ncbi:hypothetical protein AN963_11445 [Brevibacillus choshinensis]|uniref:Uncharacterized protein n=1 Tax=Brevibacillus choshinensis TaxID=54911 RepID=A0ABR5N4V4_BRECH|nr:hypothetical protein [Brevibacillus choshinensis]KQL45667.1 hypothetical protein AN963_11445 [Brevibacillus choshinensis]
MDFQDKLRSLLGETIEVITGLQVETGVLIHVGDSTATILSAPGSFKGQGYETSKARPQSRAYAQWALWS